MNFGAALEEVLSTVKRPDKTAVIKRKLNAAISFYSLDNEFSRDFVETSPALDSGQYTQSLALSLFERFRKFKYIKAGGTTRFLERAEFNARAPNKESYYVVGDSVNIKLLTLAASLDVGYYAYPPTLTEVEGFNTYWMLDVSPYMIIDRACAEIFRDIGDEESYRSHWAAAGIQYAAARKDLDISTQ